MECTTDDTIDISEWTDFGYHGICQYWDKQKPEENPRIGRWLGMSHIVGRTLCYWILIAKSQAITRTTVKNVTKYKAATYDPQRIIVHYNKLLAEDFGWGDHYASDLDRLELFTNDEVPNPYETYKESYNGPNVILNMDDYVNNVEDA